MTEADYYEQLRACIVRFREALGWGGQPRMANALGVPLANYKKMETDTRFPLHLVERLCVVTGWRIEDVVLGRFGRLLPRHSIDEVQPTAIAKPLQNGRNKKRTRV